MIHLLPTFRLRFPWQRKRPVTRPTIAAEPATVPVEAPWTHRPPAAFQWAQSCGWCRGPIPADSVDPEFCSPRHASDWLLEQNGPTYGPALPPIQGCAPPPSGPDLRVVSDAPPEPSWMAHITAWERAKAERLVAERIAPTGTEKAA